MPSSFEGVAESIGKDESEGHSLMMYLYLWEFRVKKEWLSEFEDVYGPEGAWVLLFRRAEGYLGSELLRDARDEARYVTIDRWISREALESFHARFREEYEALDRRCERFTSTETKIGDFEPPS